AVALLACWLPAGPVSAADFATEVKPVLAKHCASCHGPEKQRGGLRLDSAAGLRAGGDSGAPVVPGDSAEGRLYQATTGASDVPAMPPKGPRLAAAEVGRIKAWIDQGAKLPAEDAAGPKVNHWAFRPVARPVVPSPRLGPVRNPIDAFILARLEKEGLKPSPEADRVTLLRRAALAPTRPPPPPAAGDA